LVLRARRLEVSNLQLLLHRKIPRYLIRRQAILWLYEF